MTEERPQSVKFSDGYFATIAAFGNDYDLTYGDLKFDEYQQIGLTIHDLIRFRDFLSRYIDDVMSGKGPCDET